MSPIARRLVEIDALAAEIKEPELPAERWDAVVARLTELLQHDDDVIRRSAGGTLAHMLEIRLQQPALSADQRDRAMSLLSQLLEHPSEGVRASAVWSLAALGDRRSIPYLIDQLGDADETTRTVAELMLKKVTGESLGRNRGAWKRWWKAHQTSERG